MEWHIPQMANSQYFTVTNLTQWSPKWKFISRNDFSKSIRMVKRGKMDSLKSVMDTREQSLVQSWPWLSKKKMTVSEILIKPGSDGRACSRFVHNLVGQMFTYMPHDMFGIGHGLVRPKFSPWNLTMTFRYIAWLSNSNCSSNYWWHEHWNWTKYQFRMSL